MHVSVDKKDDTPFLLDSRKKELWMVEMHQSGSRKQQMKQASIARIVKTTKLQGMEDKRKRNWIVVLFMN